VSQPATPKTPATLRYFVDGMDCASCARKIEDMVTRLPGAEAPKVNFTSQILTLELDESRTPRSRLEANIRTLGYAPTLKAETAVATARTAAHGEAGHVHDDEEDHSKPGHDHGHDAEGHVHALDDSKPWYATRQAQLVFLTGALAGAAWLFGFLEPQLSTWGFIAATLIGTYPLARRAFAAARFGNPWTIEMLVTIAAIGAIGIGEAPEAVVVVFFFMIGELLEGIAAGRARAGIKSLAALAPKTAFVVHSGGEGEHAKEHTDEVPAERLEVGQLVRVQPGGRVPCDGEIVKGASSLDDSPVTGESVPVNKAVGDTVFAGSINGDAVIDVRVTKAANDNTIARIIKLVEEAENGKGNTARFIDRFSRYWTPGVVLVSALVAVIPPLFFGGVWHDWLYKGVSLLLIGCPCALVLSVPAAITSGLSSGARRGLLIKGGAALEDIGSVRTIAFDKTGTLTAGKPLVTDVVTVQGDEASILRLAAGVENGSSHPLAKAILERAKAAGITAPANSDAKAVQGKAAIATVEGRTLAVGSPKYAAELAPLEAGLAQRISALEASGKTVVVLLEGPTPLALFAIRDEPRADAREAIRILKDMGVSSVMLTGDNARTGKAIAGDLGLDVRAELLPENKLTIIGELKQTGKVAMIGDGINDAPALAKSDVGIAMGSGTDVALETANAAILRSNVMGVVDLVMLSRAVMGNIKVNIGIALGLKAVFLVTTLLGITNLWTAILADTGATALVTANALRLLGFKGRSAPQTAAPLPAVRKVA
jgi:Cd2+/Zn2+-exporting ATPase